MLPKLNRALGGLACLVLIATSFPARAADPQNMDAALHRVAREWAEITYRMTGEDGQAKRMDALAREADALRVRFPGRAEPLIWEGVIASSQARYAGGFDALGYAKQARSLLETAGRIDYRALDGAVPTSLGALYYKVPGFPLGFGDDDKARSYLEQALQISPEGLDSNFFYGDFLYEQEDYAKAAAALKRALAAPAHPDRPVWDAGRRGEARALLAKIQQKLAAND